MKLRILRNSIRLRLGRGEVRRLADEGRVAESTRFGPAQQLVYALESAADITQPTAAFEDGQLVVRVPRETVRRWASTDEVGIRAIHPTDAGGAESLSILIEKDFECLDGPPPDPRDEPFPHPRGCGAQ